MTGAIFCETRPAIIIRSDWRGEPRKTSAPKRATSKREAAKHIISMAQQASPKDMGQMELRRAQFTRRSSWAKRMPSFLRKLVASSGVSSVTPFASCTAIGESPVRNTIFARCARNCKRTKLAAMCRLSLRKRGGDADDARALAGEIKETLVVGRE